MSDDTASSVPVRRTKRPKSRPGPLKSAWIGVRGYLSNSPAVRNMLASVIASAVRFVYRTNRQVEGSDDIAEAIRENGPAIAALWHGQHLLGPMVNPRDSRLVAMFSRSADAELNALAAEKLGFEVVRGSGGRSSSKSAQKGGARALIVLKKSLDEGSNVAMIADIPHGTPREAGLGIVTLARISGRPILPLAIATSRRKVLERSWDKTTINLPFGRRALALGDPVFVPASADDELMEEKRREVTASLNRATERAYQLVEGSK